ncbi:MAG: hypothetical protein L3J06_08570 [Cyclobacteriaceae bacterium]|nr:hypothetical protein [Cyclobacteriaceae bacterium]
MKKTAIILGLFLFSYGASPAQELLELLKKDLNKEKRALVAEAMDIKEENKTDFWQLYGEYETEINRLIDLRAKNIEKFAESFENLNDEVANELVSNYFEIETGKLKNNKAYYKKMKKVIGAVQAARFIQIMEQVQLLIDVQVASEVPLVE